MQHMFDNKIFDHHYEKKNTSYWKCETFIMYEEGLPLI